MEWIAREVTCKKEEVSPPLPRWTPSRASSRTSPTRRQVRSVCLHSFFAKIILFEICQIWFIIQAINGTIKQDRVKWLLFRVPVPGSAAEQQPQWGRRPGGRGEPGAGPGEDRQRRRRFSCHSGKDLEITDNYVERYMSQDLLRGNVPKFVDEKQASVISKYCQANDLIMEIEAAVPQVERFWCRCTRPWSFCERPDLPCPKSLLSSVHPFICHVIMCSV